MAQTRTDNAHFAAKLALRQRALAAAGWPSVAVLDLCAGTGRIWAAMRASVAITAYLPCDRAPRLRGAIKGDAAVLVRSLDLSPYSVIDVDTYGEPWEIWLTLAARLTREVVVFLTWGHLNISLNPSRVIRQAAGLPDTWTVPASPAFTRYLGQRALAVGLERVEVVFGEVIHYPRVSYYALRVRPKAAGPSPRTPAPSRARRSTAHARPHERTATDG